MVLLLLPSLLSMVVMLVLAGMLPTLLVLSMLPSVRLRLNLRLSMVLMDMEDMVLVVVLTLLDMVIMLVLDTLILAMDVALDMVADLDSMDKFLLNQASCPLLRSTVMEYMDTFLSNFGIK